MRVAINWNEVRAKAAAFSERHKAAHYEKGETQTFYNEFFALFGIDRKQVAVYEQRVRNLPGDRQGFIDLFMPGTLIVEQKSAGLDLRKANDQALNYYEALPAGIKPRYILTCDFQNWHLIDLERGGDGLRFTLPELKKHITNFAFITGNEVRQFKNQKPANPKATELLTKLHKQLAEDGYSGHKLQLLLVRILFCLFADDTGIWDKDRLLIDLQERTQPDGSDLGGFLTQLFQVLDTPQAERQTGLPDHLRQYPHINGKLFEERIDGASFNNALRDVLIDASAFNWGEVSPAIFGALFEGVIDKVTRRAQGAHYTPEEAIFRVIGPLFLEDLLDEFAAIKARAGDARAKGLAAFHEKLASLTFFDPACGAGNFLVVTYRELRELERQVIEELHPPGTRLALGAAEISKVSVEQFYGIEIDEFPSQIAQVALWMTDHIANVNLGNVYGEHIPSIPLVHAPHIRCGDALEVDWNAVLPAERCSYVFGNPPFVGQSYQSLAQRLQMKAILKRYGKSAGSLDYVAAWYLKAGDYLRKSEGRIAFVATNSITQGEQVTQLWPHLFGKHDLEISFAHRTFAWPGRANVHCIIVGMDRRGNEPQKKRLFSYVTLGGEPIETHPDAIAAYLIAADEDTRHNVVTDRRTPIGAPRPMRMGSKIVDGGNYIFDGAKRASFLLEEPKAERLLAPLIGSKEFIQGGARWILNLQDRPITDWRGLPAVAERVRRVRKFREASKKAGTKKLAETPLAFEVDTRPSVPYLVVPEVSSERRAYVPMAWAEPPSVPTNLVQTLTGATLYDFAILTSAMHMAWLRQIGGRLKSDYRYSIGLVYNTFAWPEAGPAQRAKIEALAQAVLDARAMDKNASATLADLYDPDFMPPELRKAHRELDAAVDKLYNPRGFADERARVEHLFKLYERLVDPLTGDGARQNARVNRKAARSKRAVP